MRRLSDFFILCSGVHVPFIERSPSERSKYAGLGAAIFFTGVFAFFASAFALYTVFDNYFIAIVLGLIWGLMIFNLDRYIVTSMRKEGNFRRELISALPRIVVAIVISVVIAKPLELRIFQKEIEPELVIMEQKVFAKQEEEVRARFAVIEGQIATQLQEIAIELRRKEAIRDSLVKAAQQEADGTGGSRLRNPGPIYQLKKQDAMRADQELDQTRREMQPTIEALNQKRIAVDTMRSAELARLELSKRDGLAARMEALSNLKAGSPAIWWTSLFIVLLFIALETVPVFVKLISPKGPCDSLLRMEEAGFEFRETEHLGAESSNTRRRADAFGEEERTFANEKLKEILRRS